MPGPDRFDDGRRAALLAMDRVVDVAVLGGVDVGDRASTHHVGHAVAQQRAPNHQHARRARTADELVRADEHGVLVRQRVLGALRVHVDLDVRSGAREVPERQRPVAVQQIGDGARVRHDAGHVRRRRERSDLQRPRLRSVDQLGFELRQIDVPVGVLGDRDHVGDRFAPRQLVGVVLERPDEDDRTLAARDVLRQIDSVRRDRRGAAGS